MMLSFQYTFSEKKLYIYIYIYPAMCSHDALVSVHFFGKKKLNIYIYISCRRGDPKTYLSYKQVFPRPKKACEVPSDLKKH